MKVNTYLKYGVMSIRTFLLYNYLLSDREEPLEENTYKAPSLVLKNQNGVKINLKDLEGKVVFINFWATWGPPCIAEMTTINKLDQQYEDDEKVVVFIIPLVKKLLTAIDV